MDLLEAVTLCIQAVTLCMQADAYEHWAMDLLEEADEHATIILLALPLVTADVWGREFNKLWPRSTLEAAHGCGIGDETVC